MWREILPADTSYGLSLSINICSILLGEISKIFSRIYLHLSYKEPSRHTTVILFLSVIVSFPLARSMELL